MKRLTIISLILIVVLIAGCAQKIQNQNEKNCEFHSDCLAMPYASEAGPAEWNIFCDNGLCRTPLNYTEWEVACKENSFQRLCFRDAAYFVLRKSYEENYTIVWSDAFRMCENYEDDIEACKNGVCDGLALGDGGLKRYYPESIQCYNESRISTSCQDGIRNGGETDVDCGGDCESCQNGSNCIWDIDCISNNCVEFRCYDICPNGLISHNKPCGCGDVRFDSVTEGIPIGLYCCDDKTSRDSC